MKRPVKCFERWECTNLRQVSDRLHSVLPGTRLRKEGKRQKTASEANQGVHCLDWEGGKPAALSPSLIQQDKTRQCFIWSLIQSYVHRLYPNNLKS